MAAAGPGCATGCGRGAKAGRRAALRPRAHTLVARSPLFPARPAQRPRHLSPARHLAHHAPAPPHTPPARSAVHRSPSLSRAVTTLQPSAAANMRTTTALLGGAALLRAAVAQAPGPTSPCNYFLTDGRTASWDLSSLYNGTLDYTWCVGGLCVCVCVAMWGQRGPVTLTLTRGRGGSIGGRCINRCCVDCRVREVITAVRNMRSLPSPRTPPPFSPQD